MSGHSKWSSIKHKKGAADAKRGKVFTKLIREITVAARSGGGDLNSNPRLRQAILAAKNVNMPKDNIERAIKKGTGDLEGSNYEEIVYEGYGPGGAAIMVESLTDNKKRTVAEVRHILSKGGGNLGESGCVAWIFEKKGYFEIGKDEVKEDVLMEVALEAGAEDVRDEGDTFEVITDPKDYEQVREALKTASVPWREAELTRLPQNTVAVESKEAEQIIRMVETLEDNDDVQKVYTNADISDDVINRM